MNNRCTFIGNLGKDPDMRFTPKGLQITEFSVGVSTPIKRGDKWEDETDWVNITAFGNLAERAYNQLQKGSQVIVDTRYKTESWEGQDGKKKYGHKFILNSFKGLSRLKPKAEGGSSGSSRQSKSRGPDPSDEFEDGAYFDEEEF